MTTIPSKEWTKKALIITGDFETSGNCYAAITGNFDGMGISAGCLQWNLGCGSLQPLMKTYTNRYPDQLHNQYIAELIDVCSGPIDVALKRCQTWQRNNKVIEPYLSAFKTFFGSAKMEAIQIEFAEHTATKAWEYAVAYCNERTPSYVPEFHEFAFFFDIRVNHGSLKGVTAKKVREFVSASGSFTNAKKVILEWLRNQAGYGLTDAKRNCELWQSLYNNSTDVQKDLFVFAYLRAALARPEFRAICLSRRGTIALGEGWVNGEKCNFKVLLGISKDEQQTKPIPAPYLVPTLEQRIAKLEDRIAEVEGHIVI